ncbi:MAG: GNAT family N-acetyltransferase [Actinomycetota bacterium]
MAEVDVRPITPSRWKDLERLFGPNGAYSNCWCMWWRMPSKDFDRAAPDRKRSALRRLVRDSRRPGLLAYRDGDPVGWVSVAPREEFGRLERSSTLKRVDDRPVWSIVCFYIHRGHRGEGVARALLDAAVDHAARRGAKIVEGYPVDPAVRDYPAAEAYTGPLPLFESAGFREVARRGKRPVVRRTIRRRSSR